MATGRRDSIEDLIRGTEAIIKETDVLETAVGPAEATRERSVPLPEIAAEPNTAGRCEVRVSEDGMGALADFFPPSGDGMPLELEGFERLLEQAGVTGGLDMESAREAVFQCAMERIPVLGVVVARGKPPEDEIPAHLVVESALLAPPKRADSEKSFDHKAYSPFLFVKKGDVLARMIQRREGVMGSDIHGTSLPYEKRKIEQAKPGKNTVWAGGNVVAERDGRFVLQGDSFCVNEVLEVVGDVDYATGHVDFSGDVIVGGEVKRGFRIHAGGSLCCAKVIDATEVLCGGDLVAGQGILGRLEGTVRAGGAVRARFVENCTVEAGGTVEIQVGSLNSTIRTLERLVMGTRGVIVGGSVDALDGAAACQIGSPSGTRTEIHCGVDYTVERKLLAIRDRNQALALRLMQLEQLAAGGRMKAPQAEELKGKLKNAIARLNDAARSLIGLLDRNESAEISVRETVHPGTLIEICHVPYTVTSPMSHVRFRLDKVKGRVIPDKLGRT